MYIPPYFFSNAYHVSFESTEKLGILLYQQYCFWFPSTRGSSFWVEIFIFFPY